MSTDQEYIDHIANQAQGAGQISYRKRFGEYVLYVDDSSRNANIDVSPAAQGREASGHQLVDMF